MNRNNLLLQPSDSAISITRIFVVVDKSGSMSFCMDSLPKQLYQQFEKINNEAVGETTVSLSDFNYLSTTVFDNFNKEAALKKVKNYNYMPNGGTALNDAVKNAIYSLEKFEKDDAKRTDDWGYLVVVLTDGEENASSTPTSSILNCIKAKQRTGHWTFAFMVPSGYETSFINRYGLLAENVTEWSANEKDFNRVADLNMMATSGYLQQRSVGTKAVTSYFKTDLSTFDPVKSRLLDVTGNFKTYKVDKEMDITTFYQYKTGKNYYPTEGRAFYQLTKKEILQPQKSIVIRNKSTKNIYGGDVRKALNMVDSQSGVNLKVDPGNHSNYDIFVQSTSPNRKLVRGTEVLVLK